MSNNPVPACVKYNGTYYTYVLMSAKDGKLYTGETHDLDKRLLEHNQGLVLSTAHRRPFKVVYYEACLSEIDALRREKFLKSGNGKAYLKKRLSYSLVANKTKAGTG